MILQRIFFSILLILLVVSISPAQILDDSTKNIYGPKTTSYFLEGDVLDGKEKKYSLDTSLTGFQRYSFVQRNDNFYQDLGNLGTAAKPLFYSIPDQLGFRYGPHAFDLYARKPASNKYYDTKSPYSSIYYLQGGRGTSLVKAEFSRNIIANWNFGVNFNRISANKQIGANGNRDREVDHTDYSIYMAYKSKDSLYTAMANLGRSNHKVFETGGILADSIKQIDYYDYRQIVRSLVKATSADLRKNSRIYQQLQISPLVSIYDIFNSSKRVVSYVDQSQTINTAYYPRFLVDANTTADTTSIKLFENDLGVKGSLGGLSYRLYYKRKNYFIDNLRFADMKWNNDDLAGARVIYNINDSTRFSGEIEYLANSSYIKSRDFRILLNMETKYLNFTYHTAQFAPGYIQQTYFGNHFEWQNDFKPTWSNVISGNANIKLGNLQFIPNFSYSLIRNYIYFNEAIVPAQYGKSFSIITPGVDVNFNIWRFYFRNKFNLNQVSDGAIYRVPKYMANSSIYFEGGITRRIVSFQIGIDLWYKSAYMADSYMPAIQEFYLQNTFKVQDYLLADAFMNIKISRARIFFKVSHVNMGLQAKGYMVTPYYYGFRRAMDFGVSWMFFD